LELVIFTGLMGLSALFSTSETSLFSLNPLELEQLRRARNPRTTLIEELLSKPRQLIVTILIGNEFVIVSASVISMAIVFDLLGSDL
jgi:putative hemolysin